MDEKFERGKVIVVGVASGETDKMARDPDGPVVIVTGVPRAGRDD
jgi:hypothetical protein